jgi:hypothetical protein
MRPKILTAFKAAGEPITSATAMAAALAAFAAATLIAPQKRVGIDWEHHHSCRATNKGQLFRSLPAGLSGMLSLRHGEFRPSIPDWPMVTIKTVSPPYLLAQAAAAAHDAAHPLSRKLCARCWVLRLLRAPSVNATLRKPR